MAKLLTLIYKRLSAACFSLQYNVHMKRLFQGARLAVKYGMKIVGPLFVTMCILFVLYIIGTYFLVIYPLLNPAFAYFNVVVALGLGYNLLFNYMMCVRTAPGCPPHCSDPAKYLGSISVDRAMSSDRSDVEDPSKGLDKMAGGGVAYNNTGEMRYLLDVAPAVVYKYCRVCKVIKPPRTHHCSVSDKCVLNMDHFCPWMNNAIGFYNYRYFYLFLLYIFIGASYAATIYTIYYNYDTYELRSKKHYWGIYSRSIYSDEQLLIYAVALCVAAVLSVGGLLVWHTYLLVTNQTTIEYYVNFEEAEHCKEFELPFKNPFDKGWKKNIMRLAANPEPILYTNNNWPHWLNYLNWLRLVTYKMIGPLKYVPPESEHSFVIDDYNRDDLFRQAIEYNQKLLAASRRRYISPYSHEDSRNNLINNKTSEKFAAIDSNCIMANQIEFPRTIEDDNI